MIQGVKARIPGSLPGPMGGVGGVDPGAPGGGIRGYQELIRGELRDDVARLEASASLLESEFMTTLFRTMRETLPEESPGAGQSADIFWSMMEREVADQVSLQGGYGLGDLLREALLKSRVAGADNGIGVPSPDTMGEPSPSEAGGRSPLAPRDGASAPLHPSPLPRNELP